MSSVINASNDSPLVQTLVSETTNPWLYSVRKSYPVFNKSRVVMTATPAQPEFNSSSHFAINRNGFLNSLTVKMTFTVPATGAGEAGGGLVMYPLHTLIKNIRLVSSTSTILQDTGNGMFAKMIKSKNAANKARVGYSPVAAIAANQPLSTHTVYADFDFAENISQSLNSNFLENLQLVIDWGSAASVAAGAGDTPTIGGLSLIGKYVTPDPQVYNETELLQHAGENETATYLYSNSYAENEVLNGTAGSSIIELKAPHVAFRTHIIVQHETLADVYGQQALFQPILTIDVTAGGQSLVKYEDAKELLFLDADGYDYLGVVSGGNANIRNSNNVYTINWGLSNEGGWFSGGLSLKNLPAPRINLTFAPGVNSRTLVIHEYYSLKDVTKSGSLLSSIDT